MIVRWKRGTHFSTKLQPTHHQPLLNCKSMDICIADRCSFISKKIIWNTVPSLTECCLKLASLALPMCLLCFVLLLVCFALKIANFFDKLIINCWMYKYMHSLIELKNNQIRSMKRQRQRQYKNKLTLKYFDA